MTALVAFIPRPKEGAGERKERDRKKRKRQVQGHRHTDTQSRMRSALDPNCGVQSALVQRQGGFGRSQLMPRSTWRRSTYAMCGMAMGRTAALHQVVRRCFPYSRDRHWVHRHHQEMQCPARSRLYSATSFETELILSMSDSGWEKLSASFVRD